MNKLTQGVFIGVLAALSGTVSAQDRSQVERVWVEPEIGGHQLGSHTIHVSGMSTGDCWSYGDPVARFEEGLIRIEVPASPPGPGVFCIQTFTPWTKSVSVQLDYEQLGEGDALQNGYRGYDVVASFALEDGSTHEFGRTYLVVPAFTTEIGGLDTTGFVCKNLRTGKSVKLKSPSSILDISTACLAKGPKVKRGDKVRFIADSVIR